MEEFKPGQVISPQSAPTEPATLPAPAPATPPITPPGPQPVIEPTPATTLPAQAPAMDVPVQSTPADSWQFRSETNPAAANEDQMSAPEPDQSNDEDPAALDWTAAEFISHDKSPVWYAVLTLAALMAAIIIFLLSHDKISSVIVILAALFLGAFAARKPKLQQYSLRQDGVGVGQKVYYFHDFKTFSVAEEGTSASVVFMPLKRFMPPLTIYVTPELADQVVDFLSAYLPFTQHKADAIDSLLRKIRF